jgi:hypothetical protein
MKKKLQKLTRIQKLFFFSYFFFTGWGMFWILTWLLVIGGWHQRAWGNPAQSEVLTTVEQEFDLSNKSFSELSPAALGGQISVPPSADAALDFDSSMEWEAGQHPTTYWKLGFFGYQSLDVQDLSLENIEQIIGQNLSQLSLASFELIASQTLEDLVRAIPQLENIQISQLSVVQDVLTSNGYGTSANQTLGELLANNEQLQDLTLNSTDLSQYTLDDLPGAEQTPIEEFSQWQNSTITDTPGLENVPFNQFPSPMALGGHGPAQIDWILSQVETPGLRSVSGGYNVGFNFPCPNNCAHVELVSNPLVEGGQLISGQFQEVDGGHGSLKGDGQEPTGIHPYGPIWKVVLWDVDETTGTVSFAWFMRFCDIFGNCTPYEYGPFIAESYREGDWILTHRQP